MCVRVEEARPPLADLRLSPGIYSSAGLCVLLLCRAGCSLTSAKGENEQETRLQRLHVNVQRSREATRNV